MMTGGRVPEAVFSVGELTQCVKSLLEREIGDIQVEGEISNYRRQASGHQYFTLKDEAAQISCVLFKGRARSVRGVRLEEGAQVRVSGELSVYAARGQYQILVSDVQPMGKGALYEQFEALKRKLQSDGLFAPSRKRALPAFPASVCMVTSASGAALRDMIDVSKRRAPWVEIAVYPVRVQGDGAAEEIVDALRHLAEWSARGVYAPDVVVVARGGGSIEDLWEFNREPLARAIAAFPLPLVSGVGHETDFTIADFVADVRAPTPSAAAELVMPDRAELLARFTGLGVAASREVASRIARAAELLKPYRPATLRRELVRYIELRDQQVDDAAQSLRTALQAGREDVSHRLSSLHSELRIHNPMEKMERLDQRLRHFRDSLNHAARRSLGEAAAQSARLESELRLLGPQATLKRGFTLTLRSDGELLRCKGDLNNGERITTRFHDGDVESTLD